MAELDNKRPYTPWQKRILEALRLGFYLLYNQFAWSYDLVAWSVSMGQWRDWGKVAIPFIQGHRVLDLAHGPGNLLSALHRVGLAPIGYDLSPAMGRITRRKLRRIGLLPGLARGRAQELPFASRSFDSVVSTFPTEFIQQPETLDEIARVLVPDGVFVMIPSAVFTGRGPITQVVEWLYTLTGQRSSGTVTFAHQMKRVGFESTFHWVPLPRSQVMVVVSTISHPQD